MTNEQEIHHLRQKISDHADNIAQMETLIQRAPSDGLRSALESEVAQRDAARTRLSRLEEIIRLSQDIEQVQGLITQQQQHVHALREEREAVQRRLTQAETELNKTRIDLSEKQQTLQQKHSELGSAPAQASAPAAASAPSQPGGTVRLGPFPAAALRLPGGKLEQFASAEVIVGREKMQGIDIAMNEQTVSGTHARISFDSDNNQWTITDLGSANGTWVGESQLSAHKPAVIQHGAQLRFGRAAATFELLG